MQRPMLATVAQQGGPDLCRVGFHFIISLKDDDVAGMMDRQLWMSTLPPPSRDTSLEGCCFLFTSPPLPLAFTPLALGRGASCGLDMPAKTISHQVPA